MSCTTCRVARVSLFVTAVLLAACGRSDMLAGPRKDASLPGGSDLLRHPWPVFGRDPQGTRSSPVDTSGNTGHIAWRLELGKGMKSSPVIAEDGTIYVYSEDRTLYAVAPPTTTTNAMIKWSYTAPAPDIQTPWDDVRAAPSPAIGPDGTVYITTLDAVYALSSPESGTNGVLERSYRDPQYFHYLSAPTVGRDGTVFVRGGNLLALDPQGDGTTGVLKWSSPGGGGIVGGPPPVVAPDGTIVFESGDTLRAVQTPVRGTNGTELGIFPDAHVQWSPAIGAEGTVYVAGYDQYVRAFALPADGKSGKLTWSYHTDSMDHTAPAIGTDGTVYVAGGAYGLFALDAKAAGPQGELKWRWFQQDYNWWSGWPAVGADGTIYLAGKRNVHAISPPKSGPDGVFKWAVPLEGEQISAPSIGADGKVYVTADDALYAIQ